LQRVLNLARVEDDELPVPQPGGAEQQRQRSRRAQPVAAHVACEGAPVDLVEDERRVLAQKVRDVDVQHAHEGAPEAAHPALIAHRHGRRIPGAGGDRRAEAGADSHLAQGLHDADLEGAAEAAAGEDEAYLLRAAQQLPGGGAEAAVRSRADSIDGDRAEAIDRDGADAAARDRAAAVDRGWAEAVDRGRAEAVDRGRAQALDGGGGGAEALDAVHAPIAFAIFMTGVSARCLILQPPADARASLHLRTGPTFAVVTSSGEGARAGKPAPGV